MTAGAPDAPASPYAGHRQLLDAQEIRELSQLDWRRSARDIALGWLQIVAAWTAVALWPRPWVALIAVPVIGTARYAHQVLAHDGIHRRLHPRAAWNDRICDGFLLGPVGSTTRVGGRNHLAHHRLLATEADPDRYKYASANKRTWDRLLLYLAGVTALVPQLRHVHRVGRVAEPDERGYSLRDLLLIVGWQAALFVGLTAAIGWWAYPVLWGLPVYVFMHCADLARQFLEHAHPLPDAVADERRLIGFESTPIERLFLSPHHMNHHIAHHLWPSIPYYNLPEANRRARSRNRSDALRWWGTYRDALRHYWSALPLAP